MTAEPARFEAPVSDRTTARIMAFAPRHSASRVRMAFMALVDLAAM
jgi:hypothetical protein